MDKLGSKFYEEVIDKYDKLSDFLWISFNDLKRIGFIHAVKNVTRLVLNYENRQAKYRGHTIRFCCRLHRFGVLVFDFFVLSEEGLTLFQVLDSLEMPIAEQKCINFINDGLSGQ